MTISQQLVAQITGVLKNVIGESVDRDTFALKYKRTSVARMIVDYVRIYGHILREARHSMQSANDYDRHNSMRLTIEDLAKAEMKKGQKSASEELCILLGMDFLLSYGDGCMEKFGDIKSPELETRVSNLRRI